MRSFVRIVAFFLAGLLLCVVYLYVHLDVFVDILRDLIPDLTTRLTARFFVEAIVPSSTLLFVSVWLGFWKDGFRPLYSTVVLAMCVLLPWVAGYVLIRLGCGIFRACL